MQQVTIAGKDYVYLSPEEAVRHGITWKPWREGQPGDHVLTDDGWVVPVLKVGKAQRHRWVRIPTGTFLTDKRIEMTSEKRDSVTSIIGVRTNYKDPNRRLSRLERRFVFCYLANGGNPEAAYETAKGHPGTVAKVSHIFNRANVKMAINDERRRELQDAGIGAEWIAQQVKELMASEIAGSSKVEVLKLAAEMAGMRDQKDAQASPQLLAISAELRAIEKSHKELTADAGERDGKVLDGEFEDAEASTGHEAGHADVRPPDVPEGDEASDPAVP